MPFLVSRGSEERLRVKETEHIVKRYVTIVELEYENAVNIEDTP